MQFLSDIFKYIYMYITSFILFNIFRDDKEGEDEINNALLAACKDGNISKAQEQLERKANVNCIDKKNNKTPLHVASRMGREDLVLVLLNHGANVHAKDKYGYTALHTACYFQKANVGKALLTRGASVTAVNNLGYTPLHLACQQKCKELIIKLLACGADPEATGGKRGKKPFQLLPKHIMDEMMTATVLARTQTAENELHHKLCEALRNLSLINKNSSSPLLERGGETYDDIDHDKFNGVDYMYDEADILMDFMCLKDMESYYRDISRGVDAIIDEMNQYGSEEDKECLHYVLNERAGSSSETFQHGLRRDCDENGNVLSCRKNLTFESFVEMGMKFNLNRAHILALRLYTTKAYQSINTGLRDKARRSEGIPFKFPVTVHYIDDALDRLRHDNSVKESENSHINIDLWRGMSDIDIPASFLEKGGAEISPMSTTSNLEVALKYALRGTSATLFLFKTDMYLDRGADISWLSCFPAENEYLYRPVTTLLPQKKAVNTPKLYKYCLDGTKITVLEVKPKK